MAASQQRAAGIILAGGRSRRMGSAKALLDWGGRPLLAHVVEVVASVGLAPVVVVAAAGQRLPDLAAGTLVARDEQPDRGPLEALRSGLAALPDGIDRVFLAATDMPLLHTDFVRAVVAALDDPQIEIALPLVDGHRQPLAAAYRVSLLSVIDRLRADGTAQLPDLLAAARVRVLDGHDLPHPESVRNLNTPADYEAARSEAR